MMQKKWTRAKNVALCAASLIISLLLAELGLHAFIGNNYVKYGQGSQNLLFQTGENLRNVGDIFLYYPNKAIRVGLHAIVNEAVFTEYDYVVETNNLGLVQRQDIKRGAVVEIFYGDSFTEGQGASPWFYQLEATWDKPDRVPVNAAILGTGPQQWQKLHEHLLATHDLKPQRVNLIAIPDDFIREVWNFSDEYIDCFRHGHESCYDGSGITGYDFTGKSSEQVAAYFLALTVKLRRARPIHRYLSILAYSSALFGNTLYLLNDLKTRGPKAPPHVVASNIEAAKALLTSGREPGVFFLVPEKIHILKGNGWEMFHAEAKGFFDALNIPGVRYKICGEDLVPDDFHRYDAHPNDRGYEKIKNCILAEL